MSCCSKSHVTVQLLQVREMVGHHVWELEQGWGNMVSSHCKTWIVAEHFPIQAACPAGRWRLECSHDALRFINHEFASYYNSISQLFPSTRTSFIFITDPKVRTSLLRSIVSSAVVHDDIIPDAMTNNAGNPIRRGRLIELKANGQVVFDDGTMEDNIDHCILTTRFLLLGGSLHNQQEHTIELPSITSWRAFQLNLPRVSPCKAFISTTNSILYLICRLHGSRRFHSWRLKCIDCTSFPIIHL
jgi:hypothetical protein